ncbi:hypothetical protein Tco_0078374 [Tanacetum coccineum]
MGGIGGGSFAIRSMVAKDGLGGGGFVVEGGRSPSTSSKDGEDSGVANKSSMGSRLVVTGEALWRKGMTRETAEGEEQNDVLFIEENCVRLKCSAS